MTKKTKKIIWWVVGIWIAISIIPAIFYHPSNEQDATVQAEAPAVKTINTADDAVLTRCKNLYNKLMSFKDSRDFHFYGFGEGGDFNGWYKAAHNFTKEDDLHLMQTYGFVSGDILTLGQEYVSSKGQETDYSRQKRKELEQIFSSETWLVSE